MGIFQRINDIANANIVEIVDKAEDPSKMVRLIISEMEDAQISGRASKARPVFLSFC